MPVHDAVEQSVAALLSTAGGPTATSAQRALEVRARERHLESCSLLSYSSWLAV
jgi:hypothetical protein